MAEYHIYDLLWQVTQKEKQTNELQLLPKTFYEDIDAFLKTLDKKDLSEDEQATKKNTLKLRTELFERRKQKLLIYAAYKKQIPQPAVQSEQEFYNNISDIIKNTRLKTDAGPTKQAATLKSLQTIPEIILPSGKKFGPLSKDQIIDPGPSEEDAKFLLDNALCAPI